MKATVGLVALLSLVALADCGGGGSGAGNASCREILKKYESCGVFAGGDKSCHAQPEREYDECLGACVDQGTCAQVEAYVCNGTRTACMNQCANADFICDSGQHVDPQAECDGFNDCDDDSDENGCEIPIYRCEVQGQEIPGGLVCDGEIDCSEVSQAENLGSDEQDCGEFLCFGVASAEAPGQSLIASTDGTD